jgi:hypothetical protein
LTLTITISGEGNLKALAGPALPALDGFKAYETVSNLNISKAEYRVRGSKVFKTVLKPDVSGDLKIPPIRFSFFDPKTNGYRTVQSTELRLKVAPSAAPDSSAPAPSFSLEGVKVVGQDIRFIKTEGRLKARRSPLVNGKIFLWLNLLPTAAFLGLWGWRFRQARLSSDRAGFSFRRAFRKAEKGRLRADALINKGDLSGYYAALHRVLMEYLGDKLKTPARGLTWDFLEEELRKRALPPDVIKSIRELWEDVDRVRFAPSLLTPAEAAKHGEQLGATLKQAESLWR